MYEAPSISNTVEHAGHLGWPSYQETRRAVQIGIVAQYSVFGNTCLASILRGARIRTPSFGMSPAFPLAAAFVLVKVVFGTYVS